MRQGQHFHYRDEMKEDGKTTEVDADGLPALAVLQHGGKDRNTRARVKDCRNSEPK